MTLQAPRIYRFAPELAGDRSRIEDHFARIHRLGFDLVLLTDCQEVPAAPGPWPLRPHVRAVTDVETVDELVPLARAAGLGLLVELRADRVRPEAPAARAHPDWFHDPRAEPPSHLDPRPQVHPWLRLRIEDSAALEAWVAHLAECTTALAGAGVAGLLAREAHALPAAFWLRLASAARAAQDGFVAIADVLGAPVEAAEALAADGAFNQLLNSAAWWDLRAPWFLDQYERLRGFAGSISSPEPPFGPRLAQLSDEDDPARLRALCRFRYAVAATTGTGLLVPAGFEWGMRETLDDGELRPGDFVLAAERAPFDLSDEITRLNRLFDLAPALAVPGPQRRASAPDAEVAALLRLSGGSPLASEHATLALFNPDPARNHGLAVTPLLRAAGGRIGDFHELVGDRAADTALDPSQSLTLAPLEFRLFVGRAPAARPRRRSRREQQASEKRLQALAANRIAIERVYPELDGGRFAVKRAVGDILHVEADIFCDGHDRIAACLLIRPADRREFDEVPMRPLVNDRWAADYALTRNTRYVYTIAAWRDLYATWREEVTKKHDAGQPIDLELIEGRQLVERTRDGAQEPDRSFLEALLQRISEHRGEPGELLAAMLDEDVRKVMARSGLRTNLSHYERQLELWVDRTAAVFSAWYEMFPRSQSGDPNRHGTFDDVIRRLPYVRDLGFDVLYFPPIHPIGRTNRKGRNNSLTAMPGDPGSPYAIGSEEGGHTAIHPQLGTFEDFARLVEAAHAHGLEIALDFAIQCSPDHPWIREHPEWFDWRPDGTIKYAENPPKKYEDIVPVHFYREALPSIWYELRDVLLFWVDRGVKIFRVDNPHTKPFPFWEWVIREVNDLHPDVIFLSEAFTRPKVMKRLAKIGFQQSYTYFTWRNTKQELTEYLTELTREEPKEYMRPNFFTNTPDINPFYLQTSGRPGFQVRAMLAGTLSPVWGMYNGFELCEARAIPGKEEYLDSEKYEIRAWDWDRPGNIRDWIARLNRIRRDNPALWELTNLEFFNAWNDNILYYGKMTADLDNVVLFAVNLDPHHAQGCHFEVPLWKFGLPDHASIEVEDLLHGTRFVWHGKIQHVWLDPAIEPCAVWRLVPPGRP